MVEGADSTALPRRFWLFVSTAVLTAFGTQILAFGLAWEASAISPALTGGIVAATVAPRLVLPFLGGALADHFGPATVASYSARGTAIIAMAIALTAPHILTSPVLLICTALLLGVASAFTIPAIGVIPRSLVSDSELPRALAISTFGQQIVSLIGPAIGGVVVQTFGLRGSAAAEALGASLMALTTWRLRHLIRPAPASGEPLSERFLGGIRVILKDRILLRLVISLIALAGFALPVVSFLVPVLAQRRGWDATQAGLLAAALTVGSVSVTAMVARFNGSTRPGAAAGVGLSLSATGLVVVAVSPHIVAVGAGMAAVGVGISLYATHLGPIMLTAAPSTHLSRVQAVLLVAQSAPLLAVTLGLGFTAEHFGAIATTLVCAAGIAGAAAVVLTTPEIRRLSRADPNRPSPAPGAGTSQA